ncbi:hypothetical protein GCM10010210_46280 [Pseudonocardia hydrocarbonoxydans]
MLASAVGDDGKTAAEKLGRAPATAPRWRSRFIAHGLDGLTDETRRRSPGGRFDPRGDAHCGSTIGFRLGAAAVGAAG